MIFQEGIFYFYLILLIGGFGLIIWRILKFILNYRSDKLKAPVERYDYMNAKWLRYQYFNKGKTIQDIANDQGVSMITIKKWLDKFESSSEENGDIDLDKTEVTIIEKKKSKKKRICPYCRVTMIRLEETDTFQCPNCKKKFRDKY
ncbi:MAG: hypothetical protein ACFFDH_22740 [Promethearchaeota archaeon]